MKENNQVLSTKCRVNGFLVCDQIYNDPATGKMTLLGIFSKLRAKMFPIRHPEMVWFLSLSELPVGEHNLKISIADPMGEIETRQIIDRDFECKSPHTRINLINEIKKLKFEQAGNYSIITEIDDEIVFVDTFPVLHIDDE
tara:strand:+ start:1263 stop:1685 length:423 start_codon:yes stop_codon:yes gene_type:complete